MDISTYLEGKVASWLRGIAPGPAPSSLRIGLSNGDPLDDASGIVEPTHGYARLGITFSAPVSDDSQSVMGNMASIVFTPTSGQAFGMVTHGCIFDVTGNLLFSGPLPNAGNFGVNQTISFAIGTVQVGMGSGFSKFLAEAVLNWVRASAAMPTAPVQLTLGLSTRDPEFTGTKLQEPDSQGYVPQAFGFDEQTVVSTGTQLVNSAPIIFGPAIQAWGSVSYWAILYDVVVPGARHGVVLASGRFATSKVIGRGSGFGLQTGALALVIK